MKVDVVMCTWNSNKPYFARCLNSIKREVPVHHFILVDRVSTDGTAEAVRKVFPDAKVIESNARLALNRKIGVQAVDTEFFVFVDSDIELCDGWFRQITKPLDSRTGGIHGSFVHARKHLTEWIIWSRRLVTRFRTGFDQDVAMATSENPGKLRGGGADTLIRTSLMRDWNPSSIVSAGEDQLILRHVVRKGYVWKEALQPAAIHHSVFSMKDWFRKARWTEAGDRLIRFENITTKALIRDVLQHCVCAFLASIQTGQPLILPYVTAFQLGRIQGWFGWDKYVEAKR